MNRNIDPINLTSQALASQANTAQVAIATRRATRVLANINFLLTRDNFMLYPPNKSISKVYHLKAGGTLLEEVKVEVLRLVGEKVVEFQSSSSWLGIPWRGKRCFQH
ncbi:hypothetical protein M1N59_01735 [Dehalococcoidales bacterium]|nr:hypothetical protein [Dehalococcoidales bacterium]